MNGNFDISEQVKIYALVQHLVRTEIHEVGLKQHLFVYLELQFSIFLVLLVLLLTGIWLIFFTVVIMFFFLVVSMVFCFGFGMRKM